MISIPLIIFGSTLILKLMDRFPVIIVLGAALLGWVAGEMAMSDPSIAGWAASQHALHTVVPALGAMFVVAIGKWLNSRRATREGEEPQPAKRPSDPPSEGARMTRILVPIDPEEPARTRSAIEQVLRMRRSDRVTVRLLRVQPKVSGHVAMLFSARELLELQLEAGAEDLQYAQSLLDLAGVPYASTVLVGRTAETIAMPRATTAATASSSAAMNPAWREGSSARWRSRCASTWGRAGIPRSSGPEGVAARLSTPQKLGASSSGGLEPSSFSSLAKISPT